MRPDASAGCPVALAIIDSIRSAMCYGRRPDGAPSLRMWPGRQQ